MATITDISYFVGEILLQQDQTYQQTLIQSFIDKYEPEFLRKVLGIAFCQSFLAGIDADPQPQLMLDILNGCTYTDQVGDSYYWQGLTTVGQSAIANYVYYYFQRDASTHTAAAGETVSDTENSKRISPAQKMADAWNNMGYWLGYNDVMDCNVAETQGSLWHMLRNRYVSFEQAYPAFNLWFSKYRDFKPVSTFGI